MADYSISDSYTHQVRVKALINHWLGNVMYVSNLDKYEIVTNSPRIEDYSFTKWEYNFDQPTYDVLSEYTDLITVKADEITLRNGKHKKSFVLYLRKKINYSSGTVDSFIEFDNNGWFDNLRNFSFIAYGYARVKSKVTIVNVSGITWKRVDKSKLKVSFSILSEAENQNINVTIQVIYQDTAEPVLSEEISNELEESI
jgi:hypothetical protein